jgi:hypothetical protein
MHRILASHRIVKFDRCLTPFLFFLVALLLTGCVESDVRIFVKPDGAGRITETLLMGKDLLMVGGKPLEKTTPMSDFQIKQKIEAYGGQVRLVSNEGILTDKSIGYKVVFEFDDINKFKYLMKGHKGKDISFGFKFTQGDPSVLLITNNYDLFADDLKEKTPEEKNAQEVLANDPRYKDLMKKMAELLANARITISVELGGKILDSNALYREGSVISLIDMDFNLFLPSDHFETLMSSQATKDEFMNMCVPGFKMDYQKEITVQYK